MKFHEAEIKLRLRQIGGRKYVWDRMEYAYRVMDQHLEREGLIHVESDPAGSYTIVLSLTEAGREMLGREAA